MSEEQGGLTEVLAAHRVTGRSLHALYHCRCGAEMDDHNAHVAAILTARLSEPDMVEVVAEAISEAETYFGATNDDLASAAIAAVVKEI